MTSDFYIIAIYIIVIIFGILIWFFMNISINDLSYPRLFKAGSLVIFALYPVIIKKTYEIKKIYEHFPDEIAEHLNIVIFFLAFGTLVFAEIKEASIFNADRETVNSIEDTVDKTQEKVNSVKATADETQDTVNSIEDIAGTNQRTVNSVKATADKTQEKVNSVKATADETQEKVNSVKDMADKTQEVVNTVKAKVKDIGQQVSNLDEKIDNLPSTLTTEIQDSSSQEADKTQEAVNSVKTKVDDIGMQVSGLGGKIDNLPSSTFTPENQENTMPSKLYVTLVLIACSVFISIVIGVSMLYTKQVFFDKTNSILQQNSTNITGILTQVPGLETKITKIDSQQKQMQEQMQEQIQEQKEMKTLLLDQIQKLSKKIDIQQSVHKPSDQDSSSTKK